MSSNESTPTPTELPLASPEAPAPKPESTATASAPSESEPVEKVRKVYVRDLKARLDRRAGDNETDRSPELDIRVSPKPLNLALFPNLRERVSGKSNAASSLGWLKKAMPKRLEKSRKKSHTCLDCLSRSCHWSNSLPMLR